MSRGDVEILAFINNRAKVDSTKLQLVMVRCSRSMGSDNFWPAQTCTLLIIGQSNKAQLNQEQKKATTTSSWECRLLHDDLPSEPVPYESWDFSDIFDDLRQVPIRHIDSLLSNSFWSYGPPISLFLNALEAFFDDQARFYGTEQQLFSIFAQNMEPMQYRLHRQWLNFYTNCKNFVSTSRD